MSPTAAILVTPLAPSSSERLINRFGETAIPTVWRSRLYGATRMGMSAKSLTATTRIVRFSPLGLKPSSSSIYDTDQAPLVSPTTSAPAASSS